jgi:16S rRNA G966 N2-methylase RsmD
MRRFPDRGKRVMSDIAAVPGSPRGMPPITSYIVPQKQAAKRHYGSHQYFTKRAWNVVQAYISHFSREGETVCDPYGGSGVTVTEALVLGRKAVYLDISHWACFLAEQVATAPVDLSTLAHDFQRIEKACKAKIYKWCRMSDAAVQEIPITRWYPKDARLPRNADVPTVADLFTHRQLLCLSEIFHSIERLNDPTTRNLMRYAFSATLYMCNRTFISAKGRKESRGGSSIFSIFRYKVAARTVELNPFDIFKGRVSRLIAAKRETNQTIGAWPGGSANAKFFCGYAQRLTDYVEPNSVDYIFTDPPYGSHIAYLDLTRMWDAWFGFEVSDADLAAEAIEGGDARHSPEHFKKLLAEGIAQMFRVLKYDRWMSLVFAHREPALWDVIIKAAEAAGFEYVNTVAQPLNVIWSMHKKKNPLTVLSGELILNFRKVRNPRTLAITSVGSDAVSIIKDSAELTVVQRNGSATTDQIYSDLIPKLLENGLLGDVSSKMGDLTPLLNESLDYDATNKLWYVKPGKKLGYHVPLDQRIRFYVTDFLNQQERLGQSVTTDDIIFAVLPKLKNGSQPTDQKILEEIRKVAMPVGNKFWIRSDRPQGEFQLLVSDETGRTLARPEDQYEHNEILYILAKLGQSAGFQIHIGKKEQSATWNGEPLSGLVTSDLPFLRGAGKFTRDKVTQIDLLWIDARRPVFAFEIEHSTPITTGIDRFIELLKVANDVAGSVIVAAPKSRRKKLDQVLSQSHYIGAPMYMESKIRYLWYLEVVALAKRFASQQPSKAGLVDAIKGALHQPEVGR